MTLDDVTRKLDPQDLLITDDSGPIGLAGVMGGESTEISESTTDVVIEAAHFEPVSVFRTQKRHKLGSEASKRFERGVDPELPAGCRRPGRRAARRARRRHGRARRDRRGSRPGAHSRDGAQVDLAARVTGMAISGDAGGRLSSRRSAAR